MAVLLNWVPKKCFFASLEPTCILIDQWDENEEIEFCDEFWLERILLKWKALWHKKTILPSPLTFEERRFISHRWLLKDWLMTTRRPGSASVALHPQAVTSGAASDQRKRTMRVKTVVPAAVLGEPRNVGSARWEIAMKI